MKKEETNIKMILTNEELWGDAKECFRYTNEIRAIFHYKLRKYDKHYGNTIPIETMFMYLFRRFGPPVLPYDNYKSLFTYGFQVGETKFTLHGSYHEHVYLNVWGAKSEQEAFWQRREPLITKWKSDLASYIIKNGVLPSPTFIEIGQEHVDEAATEAWLILFKKSLMDVIGEGEYTRLDAMPGESYKEDPVYKDGVKKLFEIHNPLTEALMEEYETANPFPCEEAPRVFHDGIKKTMSFFAREFPITFRDTLAFANEMRKATYTRDVSFNIAGYESILDKSKIDWESKYRVLESAITGSFGISHLANMLSKGMDVEKNIASLKALADTAFDETRIGSCRNPFSGHTGYMDYFEKKPVKE